MDGDPADTQDILKAFRTQKEAAASAARDAAEKAAPEAQARPSVHELIGDKPPQAPAPPIEVDEPHARVTPDEAHGSPIEPEVEAPPEPQAPAMPEAAPEPVAVVVAESPRNAVAKAKLSPLAPDMRLENSLMEDAVVVRQGSKPGQIVAAITFFVSLAVLILERRQARAGIATLVAGYYLIYILAALALLSIAAFFVLQKWPKRRKLSVSVMSSQAAEFARLQDDVRILRVQSWLGGALLAGGTLGVAAGYALLQDTQLLAGLALAAVIAVAGAVLLGLALARRSFVHRLYVQTWFLNHLEQQGISGGDPRVMPVLKSLDGLLGKLPESVVRQFLASSTAKDYLALIDESEA